MATEVDPKLTMAKDQLRKLHEILTECRDAVTVYNWVIVPVNDRWVPVHKTELKSLEPCDHFQTAVDHVLDAIEGGNV